MEIHPLNFLGGGQERSDFLRGGGSDPPKSVLTILGVGLAPPPIRKSERSFRQRRDGETSENMRIARISYGGELCWLVH